MLLVWIIEHMFYIYKSWRNRPPCIGTNVYGQSDILTVLRASSYPTSRPKALAIARAFRRIRGGGGGNVPPKS